MKPSLCTTVESLRCSLWASCPYAFRVSTVKEIHRGFFNYVVHEAVVVQRLKQQRKRQMNATQLFFETKVNPHVSKQFLSSYQLQGLHFIRREQTEDEFGLIPNDGTSQELARSPPFVQHKIKCKPFQCQQTRKTSTSGKKTKRNHCCK